MRINGKKAMVNAGYILGLFGVIAFFIIIGPWHLYFGGVKGRVIDKETKEPIEGALVIYNWTGYYQFIDTTLGTNVYDYTKTNKDGYFKIPMFFRPVLMPRESVGQSALIYAHGYKYERWGRGKEDGLGRLSNLMIEMWKIKNVKEMDSGISELMDKVSDLTGSGYLTQSRCSRRKLREIAEFVVQEEEYLISQYPESKEAKIHKSDPKENQEYINMIVNRYK